MWAGNKFFELEVIESRRLLSVSLDQSFGIGGVAITDVPNLPLAPLDSAALPDGKRLVLASHVPEIGIVGDFEHNRTHYYLLRYLADGTLDSMFGNNGIREIRQPQSAFPNVRKTSGIDFQKLAIQADGRILVGGTYSRIPISSSFGSAIPTSVADQADWAVERLRRDGSRDASFSGDGVVIVDFNHRTNSFGDILVTDRGRIVLGGSVEGPTLDSITGSRFALAQLNPDGSIDRRFGSGGKVTTAFDEAAGISCLNIDTSGRILAGGNTKFARYNPNGSMDSSFGSDGRVTVASVQMAAFAYDSEGRIVVVGGFASLAGDIPTSSVAIARLSIDGKLDLSFGINGIQVSSFISGIPSEKAVDVAIDDQDRICVAVTENINGGVYLARYTTSGFLDDSLSPGGFISVAPETIPASRAIGIEFDSMQKLVVYGAAGSDYFSPDNFLVRYVLT